MSEVLQSTLRKVAQLTAAYQAGEVKRRCSLKHLALGRHEEKLDLSEASLASILCCAGLAEADTPMALSKCPSATGRLPDIYRTCQTPVFECLLCIRKQPAGGALSVCVCLLRPARRTSRSSSRSQRRRADAPVGEHPGHAHGALERLGPAGHGRRGSLGTGR